MNKSKFVTLFFLCCVLMSISSCTPYKNTPLSSCCSLSKQQQQMLFETAYPHILARFKHRPIEILIRESDTKWWLLCFFNGKVIPPSIVIGRNGEKIYRRFTPVSVDKQTFEVFPAKNTQEPFIGDDFTSQEMQLSTGEKQKIFEKALKALEDPKAKPYIDEWGIELDKYYSRDVFGLEFNPDLYEVWFNDKIHLISEKFCIGVGCSFYVYLKKDTLEWVAISR